MRVKRFCQYNWALRNSHKVGNIIIYFREYNHDSKFDFGQNYSGNDQAELYNRIILAPAFARALHKSYKDSIQKHEKKFGSIKAKQRKIKM